MRRLLAAKASLYAFNHQISEQFPGDTAGRRHLQDDVAIAGVEYEGDTTALIAPALGFNTVGSPSKVRTYRDGLTVMGSTRRLAGVALQRAAVL